MTLFIWRADHRDIQGIQPSSTELLNASADASNGVMRIDGAERDEIEEFRDEQRRGNEDAR